MFRCSKEYRSLRRRMHNLRWQAVHARRRGQPGLAMFFDHWADTVEERAELR